MCSGTPRNAVWSLTPKALTLCHCLLGYTVPSSLRPPFVFFCCCFCYIAGSTVVTETKTSLGAEKRQLSTPAHPVIVGRCADRARHCPRPLYLKAHFTHGVLLIEMMSAGLNGRFMSAFSFLVFDAV